MPFNVNTANTILGWAFGKNTLDTKKTVYIGLCANRPEDEDGYFDELSGKGYARVLVGQSNNSYPDSISSPTDRKITNSKQINWAKATERWLDVKGMGLFEEPSGGTPFYYCNLDEVLSVEGGAVALFDPGALCISFAERDVSSVSALSSDVGGDDV